MKKGWSVAVTVLVALAATACGSGSGEPEKGGLSVVAAGKTDKAEKVLVGTSTTYPKVFYIDDKGDLAGFDIDLVKEIDRRLPEYEIEFRTMEFPNLLLSLETDKIDFVAAQMLRNPERDQKYSFNQVPYAHRQTKIIVGKDNQEPIRTLDDLKGKKVLTNATSAQATLLENYNKAHGNAIKIVYQSGAANDAVGQISSGRVDATLAADFTLPLIDPQGKLKSVGDPLDNSDVLYVFRKDDPDSRKLSEAIDRALRSIKEDGTLSKLSIQWLGDDYTKDAARGSP